MTNERCDILLIGYEEGENLGLRSIKSFLGQYDLNAHFESYTPAQKDKMLFVCAALHPKIVGFSLIFQRFLPDFAALIAFLRKNGISSHFTMGGHFPSVESRLVMEYIPDLDSIVRCEGEYTVLDLIQHLKAGMPFDDIPGLTFRSGSDIIVNTPRRLIDNLDELPFPARDKSSFKIMNLGVSTILSSRGCFYDCSFCSIRQFYKEAYGPRRRARSPGNVVDEMEMLYNSLGTRIFIFEDDDFYARNKVQRKWVIEFLTELKRRKLEREIGWRISCRIDDIEEDMLRQMVSSGLLCVYIGIESGNNNSLRVYNKKYNKETILKSLTILEKLHIYYEFGFMILNPYCTMETIREDTDFLKVLGRSGLALTQFTKMVPYAGTPVEKMLKTEGRLTGSPESPDYGYPDPRIALLEHFLHEAFSYRNFNPDGLVEKLRYMKFYVSLLGRYHPDIFARDKSAEKIEKLIMEANHEFLEKTSMAVRFVSERDEQEIIRLWPALNALIRETRAFEMNMTGVIDKWYNRLENEVRMNVIPEALHQD
jgi:radical SAM superfamily enzyme YgiQ (UPF0313 family)